MAKILISEKQLSTLKSYIKETSMHTGMVGRIKSDLDSNYEPMVGVVRGGGEYSEQPMIKIKVDGESISPSALFDYIKFKYKVGDEFIKQIIRDWADGKIKGNILSKNVPIS